MTQGAVYTKGWMVDLILDLAGYAAGVANLRGRAVEPAGGTGAFLD